MKKTISEREMAAAWMAWLEKCSMPAYIRSAFNTPHPKHSKHVIAYLQTVWALSRTH
jgi:hypothetical protein